MPKRESKSHLEKAQRLRAKFEQLKADQKPTGPSHFARHVEMERTSLYKTYPDLYRDLSEYGKKTQPSKSKRGAGAHALTPQMQHLSASGAVAQERLKNQLAQKETSLQQLAEKNRLLTEESASLHCRVSDLLAAYTHLQMVQIEHDIDPRKLEQQQNEHLRPVAIKKGRKRRNPYSSGRKH
jgi:hypothetical protein